MRIRSLLLFILAGTDIQSRHRFSFFLPSGRHGRQHQHLKVDWILDFLGNFNDTHLYKKIPLIDIALPLRSDKTFLAFPDGAMKE